MNIQTEENFCGLDKKSPLSKNFNILKGGRQVYRSCVAFPYRKGILYATDTPLEANSINYLYYSHNQWHKRKVFDIDGPCLHINWGKGSEIDIVIFILVALKTVLRK